MSSKQLLRKTLFICFLGLFTAASSWANDDVNNALLDKITAAQQNLSNTENRIAKQSAALAKQLNTLEQEVIALKQKTAAARRLSDEKTLSLGQLESRLKEWRDQQTYQQNMIQRFIQQHNLSTGGTKLNTGEQMLLIQNYAKQLQQNLTPSWQKNNVIMTNGKQQSLDTLSVGPVHWYWLDSEQQAGLARLENGEFHSALLLGGSASEGIKNLIQQNSGELTFDPTMDRALARQQHTETPWQHLLKGGVWVIPIMAFALLALTIALLKTWQLLRLPKVVQFTPSNIHSLLTQHNSPLLKSVKGKQVKLLDIAKQAPSDQARDDQLFVQLQQDKHGLERWLMVIGMTASVAPLLGLLGTVSGMIETFKMMTLFGSGDPEVVSGGIAQALITTELGLVVAIPALVLSAILSKKVRTYYQQLENFGILLSQPQHDTQDNLQQVAA
ncbi:MotA/TolQ/ExbB proton channel family protein [Paraglaciecola sp. 2405UD69-4]|uniref:MotA/TolQ/ExbB proton channel family protein n=1 Tax=Paraglaciecola sp. 2405UD69-4 TaxID=3391836 RepID=UPI0039C91AC3